MAKIKGEVVFTEIQRFKQIWLWLLIGGMALVFWAGFFSQVIFGRHFGSNPISNLTLTLVTAFMGVVFPYFFYYMRLKTNVRPEGIYVRFYPFHLKNIFIPIERIATAEAVKYNPILDFGGWGIRWGFGGKAYNVSGNKGVQLVYKDGKRLLIGSQKHKQFAEIINRLIDQK